MLPKRAVERNVVPLRKSCSGRNTSGFRVPPRRLRTLREPREFDRSAASDKVTNGVVKFRSDLNIPVCLPTLEPSVNNRYQEFHELHMSTRMRTRLRSSGREGRVSSRKNSTDPARGYSRRARGLEGVRGSPTRRAFARERLAVIRRFISAPGILSVCRLG